jgi:hypothetical protein
MLFNADWGFFAPLRLCVIFALKKISSAEVFGYAPVKNQVVGMTLILSEGI